MNNLLPATENGYPPYHFHDNDSEELFKKNLKTQGPDWEYRNKFIKYTMNSLGYRTLEFDKIRWDETVVMFGCSNTFGIGVNVKDSVPAQYSNITGIPAINLGVPGCSTQYLLYNSAIYLKNFPKPRGVVIEYPDSSRCTLFLPERSDGFMPVNCGNWTEDISGLGKAWRRFDVNMVTHLKLMRLTLQQMWSDVPSAEYHIFPSNCRILPECKYIDQIDFARDLTHPGSKTNQISANYIAETLNL